MSAHVFCPVVPVDPVDPDMHIETSPTESGVHRNQPKCVSIRNKLEAKTMEVKLVKQCARVVVYNIVRV
jgi:hypothetical protein